MYFDTPSWQLFHDNLVGATQRYKIRARWYESQNNLSQPVLEQKSKHGFLVRKRSVELRHGSIQQQPGNQVLTYLDSESPALLLHTEPKLGVSYQRSYWLSRDGRIRATVDVDLVFMPLRWGRAKSRKSTTEVVISNYQARLISSTILELKYNALHDDQIDSITRHLPARMTRSSKYVLGVQMLHGADSREVPIGVSL